MLSAAACLATVEAAAELRGFTGMLLSIGASTFPIVPNQATNTNHVPDDMVAPTEPLGRSDHHCVWGDRFWLLHWPPLLDSTECG